MNLEDEETESDLDQSVSGRLIPGKKAGKMGIVRRKGVSKNKGSPYRSSGSSHEDEGSPVRVAGGSGRGQHKVLEQRRNGECCRESVGGGREVGGRGGEEGGWKGRGGRWVEGEGRGGRWVEGEGREVGEEEGREVGERGGV